MDAKLLAQDPHCYLHGHLHERSSRRDFLVAATAACAAATLTRNRAIIGDQFAVLVEGPARRGIGMLAGKTPQFKTAIFPAAPGVTPGATVKVRVDSATAHSLICSPA